MGISSHWMIHYINAGMYEDCAETPAGELLIFEIDHVMVIHAMDPEDLFPYKSSHMLKARQAFERFLLELAPANEPQQ